MAMEDAVVLADELERASRGEMDIGSARTRYAERRKQRDQTTEGRSREIGAEGQRTRILACWLRKLRMRRGSQSAGGGRGADAAGGVGGAHVERMQPGARAGGMRADPAARRRAPDTATGNLGPVRVVRGADLRPGQRARGDHVPAFVGPRLDVELLELVAR